MSRAFVKESDDESAASELPERPLSAEPNYVTVHGMDALLSIVQMPAGVPVATFAIGKPGAANAALFAAQMIASHDEALREQLATRRRAKAADALARPLDAPHAIRP